MDAYFVEMLRRLRLTKKQRKDAVTKYEGVAKKLHQAFYDTEYDGSTKLLIGSYGKKTNIRPPGDVDLIFKIPVEVYEQYLNYQGNGPSALLQKIRQILGTKYTTTEKIAAWGKVVLIEFAGNAHNIELLPGYEIDGVFMIPNSEDGGSWESFDARADLCVVSDSNATTGGQTRKLIRIIKRWYKLNKRMTIKPYELEKYCADFLAQPNMEDKSWSELVGEFFGWLYIHADKDFTYIETAKNRAAKARGLEVQESIEKACEEWSKIFDKAFPAYSKDLNDVYKLSQQYPSSDEEYVEDLFPVKLNREYTATIASHVTGPGFMPRSIGEFLARYAGIPRNMKIDFQATTNVLGHVEFWWKVRNFGPEAKAVEVGKGLRGEVQSTVGNSKRETTAYHGTHYVECYVIKDGKCVAKALQFVPINKNVTEE